MKLSSISTMASAAFFSGLLITSLSVHANDYPTLERVDSVLTCMAEHGGQTVENLYSCSCKIDVIASKIPLDTWDEAKTFARYKRMPGEKGGLFRDSERSDELIAELNVAEEEAEKRCFVGRSHQKAKAATEKRSTESVGKDTE